MPSIVVIAVSHKPLSVQSLDLLTIIGRFKMPRSTSSRLNSVREVEEELRIRSGGNVRSATPARSWEFKGVRVSVGASLRRLGHRFSGSHRASGGSQRVIVKASFTVHKMGRGRGVLQAHVRYLGRDSASLDGQPGRFYDAARETVDARATVHEWEQDRHHFRLIVSPEQADQLDRQRHATEGIHPRMGRPRRARPRHEAAMDRRQSSQYR